MDEQVERAEFLGYFREECDEILQGVDADLLRLEAAIGAPSVDPEIVNALFRALHTIKGSAAMLELREISTLAHKLENVCDMLRNRRLPLTGALVDVLFEGRDVLAGLVRACERQTALADGNLEAFAFRVDDLVAGYEFEDEVARLLREAGFEDYVPAARIAARRPSPEAQQPDAQARLPGRTVRVEAERLDVLLDLVGELVITRTRITELFGMLQRSTAEGDRATHVKALGDAVTALSRTTAEMQEAIRKARMVPIGSVFERFPRLVRDLARGYGKEVELVVEGAETDLDKTVVDRIGEPLVHLIRNCVDHGIEAPERRRALGKARSGTIRLRASHEGNRVVVQIRDDGGGVAFERVRERGVAAGLLAAESRPTEHELLELLFAPGFSTAKDVSDISGRGVGMDVVRRAIAGLSGTLEVQSSTDVGTSFTIRLPLTLAIIRALLVRLDGELYAIPLDSVVESLRVDPSGVRHDAQGESIELRDERVPLVRLRAFFDLPRCEAAQAERKVRVVVIAAAGRRVGLVVDAFVGDHEIVIKPLSELLGPIRGISGGTILGDGSIALIVDVNALAFAGHPGGTRGFVAVG